MYIKRIVRDLDFIVARDGKANVAAFLVMQLQTSAEVSSAK